MALNKKVVIYPHIDLSYADVALRLFLRDKVEYNKRLNDPIIYTWAIANGPDVELFVYETKTTYVVRYYRQKEKSREENSKNNAQDTPITGKNVGT